MLYWKNNQYESLEGQYSIYPETFCDADGIPTCTTQYQIKLVYKNRKQIQQSATSDNRNYRSLIY